MRCSVVFSKWVLAWAAVAVVGLGVVRASGPDGSATGHIAPPFVIDHPGLAAAAPVSARSAVAQAPAEDTVASSGMVVSQYCIGCHNDRVRNPAGAPLRLDQLDLSNIGADAEQWEKVVRRLRTRSMPPAGARRPDE